MATRNAQTAVETVIAAKNVRNAQTTAEVVVKATSVRLSRAYVEVVVSTFKNTNQAVWVGP